MGPLVSLLRASWVREEFLQINRDLTNMVSILGSGEKLLVSAVAALVLSHECNTLQEPVAAGLHLQSCRPCLI